VHFWPPPASAEAHAAIVQAAAVLGDDSTAAGRAAARLDAAYRAQTAAPERAQLALAWVEAQVESQIDQAVLKARLEEAASVLDPRGRYLFRASFARDPAARCTLAAARVGEAPDDVEAAKDQMACLEEHQGVAAAVAFGRQQLASGRASPSLLNNLAWSELFVDAPAQEMVEAAEQAVAGAPEYASQNTAAAVYAEAGRLTEAHNQFVHSIGQREPLEDADWVVYGRLAEAYGLPEEAEAAYRRLRPPAVDHPTSAYRLAQRWLARLRGK
jgi:hypothetical protein